MLNTPDCVFCAIVNGQSPAQQIILPDGHPDVLAFVPLGPYVPGHVLLIPTEHVDDAAESAEVTAAVMRAASDYVAEAEISANILTSVGADATQTVMHLHVHILPRGPQDTAPAGWPWLPREVTEEWAVQFGGDPDDVEPFGSRAEALSHIADVRSQISAKRISPDEVEAYEPMSLRHRKEINPKVARPAEWRIVHA